MKYYTSVVALILVIVAKAQPSLLITSSNPDYPTCFYDNNGKAVLIIPRGEFAETPLTSMFYKGELTNNLDPFSSGLCVIKGKKNYYWIDKTGKVVKHFKPEIYIMSPFKDGYVLYWEKSSDGTLKRNLITSSGKLLRQNGFKEVSHFSEGLAGCRDLAGRYIYVDKNGTDIIQPFKSENYSSMIPGPFSNGLALITLLKKGGKTEYYYIDKTGKIVIDLQIFFPDARIISAGNFAEGYAGVLVEANGNGQDLVFIDPDGVIKKAFSKISNYFPFSNGVTVVFKEVVTPTNTYQMKTLVFDRNWKQIDIPYAINDVYGVSKTHIIYEGLRNSTCFFSLKTNKLEFEVDGLLKGMSGEYALFSTSLSNSQFTLIKLPNTILWKTLPENTIYTEVAEALKVKDEIRYLDLDTDEKFTPLIYGLNKLEKLSVSFQDFTSFPSGISKLTNLRQLDLFHIPNLTSLPEELSSLKLFSKLRISKCPKLKNLESVIEKCPTLTNVRITNYNFRPGFIDDMKKKRPGLVIENITELESGEFPLD